MRLRVRSLALLLGLRIWRCRELWCGSQTWLRSCVAVAVAQASSCGSDSTPSLGTSVSHRCGTSICCRNGPRSGKKTPGQEDKRLNALDTGPEIANAGEGGQHAPSHAPPSTRPWRPGRRMKQDLGKHANKQESICSLRT